MVRFGFVTTLIAALALMVGSIGALGQAGSAWAWGYNFEGELGDGTNTNRELPVTVLNVSGIIAVSGGDYHSLGLQSDGTVWAWGANYYGQLGDGTVIERWTAARVLGPGGMGVLTDIVGIAAGDLHNLALKSDGTVWAWGDNWWGELGDGTNTDRWTPVQVRGPGGVGYLTNVVAIATGGWHSLALKSDGTVWAWGYNKYGQLGDGTTTDSAYPIQVAGLSGVVSIAGGFQHSLAVTDTHEVRAWGRNLDGALGDGTTTNRWLPITVLGVTTAAEVKAGQNHSLARLTSGTLVAWGNNVLGQLGDGTTTSATSPVAVVGLTGVAAIGTGDYHCLARKSDGTLWTWGWNDVGQLGDGTTVNSAVPVHVASLSKVGAIAGGYSHSLAALTDNTPPAADDQTVSATSGIGQAITLTGSDADGDPITFHIVSGPGHGSLSGVAPNVTYTSGDAFSGTDTFTFKVNDGKVDSPLATVSIPVARAATTLWTGDRTGTITETVSLRQYDLRRVADNGLLAGRTIEFRVDGTAVGTGSTNGGGDSSLNWIIADGASSRTITATFAGDGGNDSSADDALLTALSWNTKLVTFDRTQRISGRTELKARLLRSDNTPLYNKSLRFSVDGTFVISRPTDASGYAKYAYYDVPDGAGAGLRTILTEWPGNGGYGASAMTATLTVLPALPYIWVMSRSAPVGGTANLYAYFRRLYDLQKQQGKSVDFLVDGTLVQTVVTDSNGVARYLYPTVEAVGVHTVRCQFAGDAWLEAGYGEGVLTLY